MDFIQPPFFFYFAKLSPKEELVMSRNIFYYHGEEDAASGI